VREALVLGGHWLWSGLARMNEFMILKQCFCRLLSHWQHENVDDDALELLEESNMLTLRLTQEQARSAFCFIQVRWRVSRAPIVSLPHALTSEVYRRCGIASRSCF
jgi:hypothetical protein